MDYKKISQDVVDHVGGISNIKGATHCVTRLRLILNDETKYDRKALENIEGVKGVLFNSGQLMIIFGTGTVNNVYDAFIELTGVKEMSQSDAKAEGMSKMGKLQQGFKVFSDIFIPIIPACCSSDPDWCQSIIDSQWIIWIRGILSRSEQTCCRYCRILSDHGNNI